MFEPPDVMRYSVLTPFSGTSSALVEARHRLIGTANLHLSEVGHPVLATVVCAFNFKPVSQSFIFPLH